MNQITITGNVVYDPSTKGEGEKKSVNFRVASNRRYRDASTGEWVDGGSTFIEVRCWRNLAENVLQTIGRGVPVIVTGRLRSWESTIERGDSSERRTHYEIDAESVGVDLRWTAATVRSTKSSAVQRQEDVAIAEATAVAREVV